MGLGKQLEDSRKMPLGWWWWWCLNPEALLEVALSTVTLDQLLPSSFWSRKAHGSRDHFTSGTPPAGGIPFVSFFPISNSEAARAWKDPLAFCVRSSPSLYSLSCLVSHDPL